MCSSAQRRAACARSAVRIECAPAAAARSDMRAFECPDCVMFCSVPDCLRGYARFFFVQREVSGAQDMADMFER